MVSLPLVSLLIACSGSTEPPPPAKLQPLPPPVTTGMASFIVGFEAGPELTVFALPAAEAGDLGDLIEAEGYDGERFLVSFLAYPASLGALGITGGRLDPAAPQTPARALPAAAITAEAIVSTNESPTWMETQELSPAMRDFQIPLPPTPCLIPDVTLYQLDADLRVRSVVEVEDGVALLIGARVSDGGVELYTIRPSGATRETALESGLGAFQPYAALRGSDQRIYLAGDGAPGQDVFVGTLRSGFAPLQPARLTDTSSSTIRWLALASSGSEAGAIYGLSTSARLERFSQGQWEVIDAGTGVIAPRAGRLAWAADRELWMVPPHAPGSGRTVTHFVNGSASSEEIAALGTDELSALSVVPGIGVVVGSAEGAIYSNQGGTFAPLGTAPRLVSVLDVMPLLDGFLCSSDSGTVVQYLPDFGYCAATSVVTGDVKVLSRAGEFVIATGRTVTQQNTRATVVAVFPAR